MSETTFSENITQNQIETPKSSHGVYDLPTGYLDPSGVLHTDIHVREMTGREEDLLASNKMSPNKKINALMAACTQRIGTITDKAQIASIVTQMTQGDRVFMVLAIRRTTLGDEYPIEEACPSCDVKSFHTLDLSTLEIKRLPDPMRRVWDLTLPSGKTARVRVATGADEDRVAKVSDEEKPSAMLLARTELLEGKAPTLFDIKNLSWKDRQSLRDQMETYSEGVDSTLDVTCPACNHEFQRDLEMGSQSFFFPDRVQKASKRSSSF